MIFYSDITVHSELTVGVDNTGYDVKFFGATSGKYMLWDESADRLLLADTTYLALGSGSDMLLYHNDTHGYIVNQKGNFLIQNTADDGDIIFKSDNGSGGNATYLTIDGGIESILVYRDILIATDGTNGNIKLGASQDLTLYHDGTNSYITNATGALKIATETSGIAVSIGHTTSETTVNDNLNVTGILDVTDATDSSDYSGDTGALRCEGGASIAKKLYIGTDLTVGDDTFLESSCQISGTLAIGVNGTGYDVTLFGCSTGAHILWDESADKLLTAGGALVDIVKDKLLIGSVAVTTTAAELNNLDGVTAGTVTGRKAIVTDVNKDITGGRNITINGELDAATLDISSTADIASHLVVHGKITGEGGILLKQMATPSAPAAGHTILYMDSETGALTAQVTDAESNTTTCVLCAGGEG